MKPVQCELFCPTNAQRFEAWKATPGGSQILKRAYAITAGFAPRYLRTGQRISADYVWHILRYRLAAIDRRLRRRGITLPAEGGYKLNNVFTAYVARHIMQHRPEWAGIFETREVAAPRTKRKVLVVEEKL